MAEKLKIAAQRADGSTFQVKGQEAHTLALLVEKGAAGVTAFDFRGGPPFRLPAYVFGLKRRHHLAIETRREPHEGGWHGKFILHTPLVIVARSDWPAGREAA